MHAVCRLAHADLKFANTKISQIHPPQQEYLTDSNLLLIFLQMLFWSFLDLRVLCLIFSCWCSLQPVRSHLSLGHPILFQARGPDWQGRHPIGPDLGQSHHQWCSLRPLPSRLCLSSGHPSPLNRMTTNTVNNSGDFKHCVLTASHLLLNPKS